MAKTKQEKLEKARKALAAQSVLKGSQETPENEGDQKIPVMAQPPQRKKTP